MAHDTAIDYFTVRGMQSSAPEGLNAALRLVMDSMPTLLYGDPADELTVEEIAVLKEGGVDLSTVVDRDPVAETAIKYAAIVESSLTFKEVAARLGRSESQVRQMIARRTLYSFTLEARRYIPVFQFDKKGKLLPNITKVNPVLSRDLHPVEVFEWYTLPKPDLYLNDDIDQTISPIAWLADGRDLRTLVTLAKRR